jgi:hypothetical protein
MIERPIRMMITPQKTAEEKKLMVRIFGMVILASRKLRKKSNGKNVLVFRC